MNSQKQKVVVLCSGGMDSVAAFPPGPTFRFSTSHAVRKLRKNIRAAPQPGQAREAKRWRIFSRTSKKPFWEMASLLLFNIPLTTAVSILRRAQDNMPYHRIRVKPLGKICWTNRRMNSSAVSVIVLYLGWSGLPLIRLTSSPKAACAAANSAYPVSACAGPQAKASASTASPGGK